MTATARLPFPTRPLVPEDRIRRGRPLDLLWRSIGLQIRARNESVEALTARESPDDRALLDVITRAATAPATTSTSGWASELLDTITAAWPTAIVPSVFSQLVPRAGLALDFGQGPIPSIPTRAATPTVAGAFVAEGAAIPVKQLALSASTLFPKKLGVLVSFSNELAASSRLNVEQIVRDEIVSDSAVVLDSVLLSATAATATTPPGLRSYGAGLTPTAGGGSAALTTDLKLLFASVAPAAAPVLILNPAQALVVAGIYDPEALAVVVSPNQPAGTVIALDAASFVVASGPPTFRVGRDALLHMNDTSTDITSGAGPTPAALANIAAPTRSMFQTNTVAVRMTWQLNWTLRRGVASVAWLTGATW